MLKLNFLCLIDLAKFQSVMGAFHHPIHSVNVILLVSSAQCVGMRVVVVT